MSGALIKTNAEQGEGVIPLTMRKRNYYNDPLD
jgi:hypothetical protein